MGAGFLHLIAPVLGTEKEKLFMHFCDVDDFHCSFLIRPRIAAPHFMGDLPCATPLDFKDSDPVTCPFHRFATGLWSDGPYIGVMIDRNITSCYDFLINIALEVDVEPVEKIAHHVMKCGTDLGGFIGREQDRIVAKNGKKRLNVTLIHGRYNLICYFPD